MSRARWRTDLVGAAAARQPAVLDMEALLNMKHFVTVTKCLPAVALTDRGWGAFPLFGIGPALTTGNEGLGGRIFGLVELGGLVQKWTGKALDTVEPE